MSVKPYYEDTASGIVIYHCDCREVLPTLEPDSVDMLLTDPPFPGLKGGTVHAGLGGVADSVSNNETVGDEWCASLDWIPDATRVSRLGGVVFCSYHSVDEFVREFETAGCSRVALFSWYKRNSPPAMANVPRFTTEFAWAVKKRPGLKWRNLKDTVIDVPMAVAGCFATERICKNGKAVHPTQKPVAAMSPFLSVEPQSILDPFVGTGTSLVAAKLSGIQAIGIEREEKYAEIAANRLRQGVLFGSSESA